MCVYVYIYMCRHTFQEKETMEAKEAERKRTDKMRVQGEYQDIVWLKQHSHNNIVDSMQASH